MVQRNLSSRARCPHGPRKDEFIPIDAGPLGQPTAERVAEWLLEVERTVPAESAGRLILAGAHAQFLLEAKTDFVEVAVDRFNDEVARRIAAFEVNRRPRAAMDWLREGLEDLRRHGLFARCDCGAALLVRSDWYPLHDTPPAGRG
jgi:hypothetical protein